MNKVKRIKIGGFRRLAELDLEVRPLMVMITVASNDLALGKIVDAVSHWKFWAATAIFV